MSIHNDIPDGFVLRHTLRGHKEEINRVAWSPDGSTLASSSFDGTVRLWDAQTGQLQETLSGHTGAVYSVAWSPDGRFLASCSKDRIILIFDMQTHQYAPLLRTRGHSGNIYDITWSPDGNFIASCSEDHTIKIWRLQPERSPRTLTGHATGIFSVAWSPTGNMLASGSSSGPIRLWAILQSHNGEHLRTLRGHTDATYCIAWSLDGTILASGSEDHTIRIWEAATGRQTDILEGHTDAVTGVSFSYDGRLLASKSRDGTVRIWRTDSWGEPIAILRESASNGLLAGIAFHPLDPTLATPGESDTILHIWDLHLLFGLELPRPSAYYANAKVVLVGDSGVGKTALGLVLTGYPFTPTESTHGRYVRSFDSQEVNLEGGHKESRETFLWDLAGQPGYRLIHQLHLNEVAVALVIFSNNEIDSLAGVAHWARALNTAQGIKRDETPLLKKFLVEARIDRGQVRLSQENIDDLRQQFSFDLYFSTSAKEGRNIAELIDAIKQAIDWRMLPKVTSTELFQRIKEFLVRQKEVGNLLSTSDNLYKNFLLSGEIIKEASDLRAQFDTCIGRVESQGLIRRLSFGGLVLLQPEMLDAYASALINVVRSDLDGLGSIPEAVVREGSFTVPMGERIGDREQEKLLLLAMIEDLLRYELALREQGRDESYLVFPSEVTRRSSSLPDPEGKTIIFNFEGPVLNIYTTLAVRLSYSGVFIKKELWRDAITYTARVGGKCGISLRNTEEGAGELTLFFDDLASEETRFQFEEYVALHLQRRAQPETIKRRRVFQCSNCKVALTDSQVKGRRERSYNWLDCPVCDERVLLLDGEERLQRAPTSLVWEIDHAADTSAKHEAAKSVIQGKIETKDFDVFLCHNNEDKSEVKRIAERLKEQGILPWLDEWELQPGLPWQHVLESQISQIKSAAVFVGQNGIGPWQQQELEAFLREFVNRGCPVIPVILSDAPREPLLPIFLRGMTWVDFRKQDPEPMDRLIWGITGKRSLPV